MTITSKTWTALGTIVAILGLIWAVFTFWVGGQPTTSVTTGNSSPVVVGNGNTQNND